MNKEELVAFQEENIEKRKAELEQSAKEKEDYLNSEQYLRDCWEHQQDLWEKKAQKEGWHYTRKPYVSEYEKQQQEQLKTREEIAFLQKRLKELTGEN